VVVTEAEVARVVPHGERFMQLLLDGEAGPVPACLRAASTVPMADEVAIGPARYLDPEFHRLEVERVWRRVWQMACREEQIAEVGDSVLYDLADMSLIVVRTARDEIRAFHNSCLHRGTQLRGGAGRVAEFRCPFHGFTWNLDGSFREMPCGWDFPHVDRARVALPEAQVGTWGGFVFVNPDPAAGPLGDYLEDLPWHFESWPLEDRYLAAHGVRVVACNWKVGLEAFMEAYHVVGVHPQLLRTSGDTVTEYDVYEGRRHISRMITPVGVPSEHLGRDIDDAEIVQAMFIGRDQDLPVANGATARRVLADRMRAVASERTGRDFSHITDAEALDGIEYFLFPNLMPWMGFLTPLVYRFRPNGNDPQSCLMEVMLLEPVPAHGPRPRPAPTRYLTDGETWADIPELGGLGRILNQDTAIMGRVQRGLRASVQPNILLARYHESRIRHFHYTLDTYLNRTD
jgi:phenylpropionate dioxygenase-like ring-hydroxylating dioxygenase large terminal subunit